MHLGGKPGNGVGFEAHRRHERVCGSEPSARQNVVPTLQGWLTRNTGGDMGEHGYKPDTARVGIFKIK